MIYLPIAVTCEHQGCTIGTVGKMRFDGFINTYSDGSYYSVPDLSHPELPEGWTYHRVLANDGKVIKSWCPQHRGDK